MNRRDFFGATAAVLLGGLLGGKAVDKAAKARARADAIAKRNAAWIAEIERFEAERQRIFDAVWRSAQ